MTAKRKRHTPEFKTRVAIEAIKGNQTSSELASQFHVHPGMISTWKKKAVEALPDVFRHPSKNKPKSEDELTGPLYQEIGRLTMQLDWLKKKSAEFNDQ